MVVSGGDIERSTDKHLEVLVEMTVRNAGRYASEPRVRWAHVMDAMGLGAQKRGLLVKELGRPDEGRQGVGFAQVGLALEADK